MHTHFFRTLRPSCLVIIGLAATASVFFSAVPEAKAGSATWNQSPNSNDWNTAGNWTPATVPSADTDTATFGTSLIRDVNVSTGVVIDGIVFLKGADIYTFTNTSAGLVFAGKGVINQSGVTQTFIHDEGGDGIFEFNNHATAGSNTVFINGPGRKVFFFGDFGGVPDAGAATFLNAGASATAESGFISFSGKSSAASALIVNQASVIGELGGFTAFLNNATAAEATITNYEGAKTTFGDTSTAGNASLIADDGLIQFYGKSNGGTARVQLFDAGALDVTWSDNHGTTIGSLEGDDAFSFVFLGTNTLTVGSNNLSTTYNGYFSDLPPGGNLNKIGTGTFTFTGTNVTSGTTTVSAGTLRINTAAGASGTGSGPVKVTGGTLGGFGTIAGAVTIGTGSGNGATLAPSVAARNPATLILQSTLTFKADSTYACQLNTRKAQADQVTAGGVTIESGAQFVLRARANRKLVAGKIFTAINNTAATPISGTFANLADGSTLTVGKNHFLVSYTGGDGNDLTLTVTP